jgi:ribosomal protein S9
VLEIFRVFYNYCSMGQDKQTPAMRMGLARGLVKLEEVLGYGA